MRSISTFFLIFLLFLFGFVVYLAVQNRDSVALRSKLIPAIVIGLVGMLFTIWFSLKSENIELKFISTIFFHKSDKKLLDEHEIRRHAYGGEQFDGILKDFIRNYIENDENIKREEFGDRIRNLYFDMAFIKLIARFFWMYADWWDISIKSSRRGNTMETMVSTIPPIPDYDSLGCNDFLEAIDRKDNFHKLLSEFSKKENWIKKMTVPPKTTINFVTSTYGRTLVLKNSFTIVSITIDKFGGSTGLGDYRWLLDYDIKKSNEFWSEHFEVTCKANFEKFKSGHPEMKRYKRWVETLFAEIQYQLDEDIRLKRARDFSDLIGHSK